MAVETRNQVKEKMKPQDKLQRKTPLVFLDLGLACPPPSQGSRRDCRPPSLSPCQAVLGWAWTKPPWYHHVWQDGARVRSEQSRALKCDLIWGQAMKGEEMAAPGSLGTCCHGDRDSFPVSQRRACCPPLPLPTIWQAQAHVPIWCIKHNKLPSFLNS